jgi:hypothetical protein
MGVSQFTARWWRASLRRTRRTRDAGSMTLQTPDRPDWQIGGGKLAVSWIVTPHGLEARWLLDESAPIDVPSLTDGASNPTRLSPAA